MHAQRQHFIEKQYGIFVFKAWIYFLNLATSNKHLQCPIKIVHIPAPKHKCENKIFLMRSCGVWLFFFEVESLCVLFVVGELYSPARENVTAMTFLGIDNAKVNRKYF